MGVRCGITCFVDISTIHFFSSKHSIPGYSRQQKANGTGVERCPSSRQQKLMKPFIAAVPNGILRQSKNLEQTFT